MDIFPIWKSTYYVSSADSVKYRIKKAGQVISTAYAVRLPDEDDIRIGLNKPCQNYVDSIIDMDATGDTPSNAYAEFSLEIYNASNGSWFEAYQFAFVNDWSYEEHDEGGGYSEPINSHAAPGQLITYTVCCTGLTAETICYEEREFDMPYIVLDPSSILFDQTGGTVNVTVTIENASAWRVANPTGPFTFSQTSGTSSATITITARDNTDFNEFSKDFVFIAWNEHGSYRATLHATIEGDDSYSKYFEKYLTIEPIEDGVLSLGVQTLATTADTALSVSYSRDSGVTWTTVTPATTGNNGALINVSSGEKIFFKATNPANAFMVSGASQTYRGIGFSGRYYENGEWIDSVRFNAYGNTMSLIYGSSFEDRESVSQPAALAHLFEGSNVVNASRLVLPSTALTVACYAQMFQDCKQLIAAPLLPSTALARRCYDRMFMNCHSLTIAPELPATTLAKSCYSQMFSGCRTLTEAPVLPATELETSYQSDLSSLWGQNTTGCYAQMFTNCYSLAVAPDLPASTLRYGCYYAMFSGCSGLTSPADMHLVTGFEDGADYACKNMYFGCKSLETAPEIGTFTTINGYQCFASMFNGCTALETAPELPATVLDGGCYNSMFSGCTALTSAPELPAETLVNGCYTTMFSGCRSLGYVKCLATQGIGDGHTYYWLSDVKSTGTFVKDTNASWGSGASGIPSGWTTQNA